MAHLVIALSLLSVIHAFNYYRQCLFYDGSCVSACPRNMHPYNTRCDGETMSQRTCDSPFVYVIGYTCGWSRCDCNGDLLLDEQTGFCVEDKECPLPLRHLPKLKHLATERRKKNRRKYHLSKRISIKEED